MPFEPPDSSPLTPCLGPLPPCFPLPALFLALAELPAGVAVGPDGVLCDESGAPLARGLKMVNGSLVVASSGAKVPKSESLHAWPVDAIIHQHSLEHCGSGLMLDHIRTWPVQWLG
jgi:hypothetical protein